MVEADCDIIVCIVGWAVRNWSVEDKAGLESREERNSGYSGDNWSQKGEWTGWILKFARKKKQKKRHLYTPIWGKKNRWKECTDTPHDKVALHSQTRGMHTSSAEYTTFITFELINRKSGGKATRITVFRKLRKEKNKTKKPNKKAAQSNAEFTCPTDRKRVNKVQWRLLTEGPNFF